MGCWTIDGRYPQPASFPGLSDTWGQQQLNWTQSWLRQLRQLSHDVREKLITLRTKAVRDAEEESRRHIIARFYDGKGLQRLLLPQVLSLHSPLLKSCVPDTLVVTRERTSQESRATGHQCLRPSLRGDHSKV